MYVRLAFAVAAHLEPEVLIIDEVLAVGDMEFQKKCLGKMKEVAGSGRTVLCVSHNMQAISTLAERTLVLKSGDVIYYGPTSEAIDVHLAQAGMAEHIYKSNSASPEPTIKSVSMNTSLPNNVQQHGKEMSIQVEIETPIGIDTGACPNDRNQ